MTTPTHQTISRDPHAAVALDQQRLFAAGLEHVRTLARRVWTDHNLADPGITTLELLCYGLTDLAYRASLPIEDLLTGPGGPEAPRGRFFSARQILPGRAWTRLDYRKLVLDIEGVRNAWIEPHRQVLYVDPAVGGLVADEPAKNGREVALRGLHRVTVDCADPGLLPVVRARLQANRNLCEDFVEVTQVQRSDFTVCGAIDLSPGADPQRVLTEALTRIQLQLAPPVPRRTLAEMLARPHADGSPRAAPDIYCGPLLEHGFIDDADLAAATLPAEIRRSDILRCVTNVEGVRAVRDLVVRPADEPCVAGLWRVPVPAGTLPQLDVAGSALTLYKGKLPVLSGAPGQAVGDAVRARVAAAHAPRTASCPDLPIPAGAPRDVGRYESIQTSFPAIYGLSADGPPAGASASRQAQVLQLKGYLLHFDQILASHCAQLAHLSKLFSSEDDDWQTYFYPRVTSFVGAGLVHAVTVGDWSSAEPADVAWTGRSLARRNRFLDHLIARFAERFHDDVGRLADDATADEVLRDKGAFLRDYPRLSAARGLGHDYTQTRPEEPWDGDNISGLERRLAALLGLRAVGRRPLGHLGPDATRLEGMLLIENILLRPRGARFGEARFGRDRLSDDPPYLPVCADCDARDDDPYSYRLHIVLPAAAGRFHRREFRAFAEDLVRQEVPAHLLAKICWADPPSMTRLEEAHVAWSRARAGSAADEAAALRALRDALYSVKSDYPPGVLSGPAAGDNHTFIVGASRLGDRAGE